VDSDDAKTKEKHNSFINLLAEAGKTISQLTTISQMLQDTVTIKGIQDAFSTKKVKPSDKVTIRLDGVFPVETDTWYEWWRGFRNSLKTETSKSRKNKNSEPSPVMRCFVTGKLINPVPTHSRIDGLAGVGGQPSGDVLVCFDKDAFQSYGLHQSANAAVSEEAMSAYRAGLNYLIKEHSYTLAGTKVIQWFKGKVEDKDDIFHSVLETSEEQELNAQILAKKLLKSIKEGKRADLRDNRYYALTLSGAAGRVMVRDWMEGSFEQLAKNITQWFDDVEIVSLDGVNPTKLSGMERFITCLLKPKKAGQKYEDWIKPVGSERFTLLNAAIRGYLIPQDVLSKAVIENRIFILSGDLEKLFDSRDGDVSKPMLYSILYSRMSLIKAFHLRKQRKDGNIMEELLQPVLTEKYPDPAYQCGRLMAVLAELQRAALGNVGAGVIQRYYAAASSTPALVIGRLIRNSQFHLNKLEIGLAYWFETKIGEISNNLKNGIPATLTLESQSLFALGYYQQLAELRARKTKKLKNKTEDVI